MLKQATVRRVLFVFSLTTIVGLGCARPEPLPELSREAGAKAADTFATQCASCRGPLGEGDGPKAAELTKRPCNFADPTWQLAISDRHGSRGGVAVEKSAEMPAFPQLAEDPEQLWALLQHVRGLAVMPR